MIELNVVSSKPYSPYQDAAHLGTSYELSNGHLLQVYKTGPSDWTVRLGCCKKANNLTWYFWKRKFADHSSAFVAGMERARQEEVNAFTEKFACYSVWSCVSEFELSEAPDALFGKINCHPHDLLRITGVPVDPVDGSLSVRYGPHTASISPLDLSLYFKRIA